MKTVTFDTVLGRFGLGWTANGLARLQLPGLNDHALERRLNRDGATAGAPTAAVLAVIEHIQAYAHGEGVAFAAVPLDLSAVPEFHRRCYIELMQVARGQTTTYGALARKLGNIQLARAVGQAMGANPIPLIFHVIACWQAMEAPAAFQPRVERWPRRACWH